MQSPFIIIGLWLEFPLQRWLSYILAFPAQFILLDEQKALGIALKFLLNDINSKTFYV